MTDRITTLADELETEARVAGTSRYAPGEIGYHAYVRRYLAETAARLIVELEDQLATTTPAGMAAVGASPFGSSRLSAVPAGEKEAASHHERGRS